MPIHVAITRRAKPGREAEFQQALRDFFQTSFDHGGVLGATMIVPPPESDSREFGILRTFADERERDDFYASPAFKSWEARCAPLTESNSWTYRPLHGLEAWFRSPHPPPPRWKMAVATFLGVFPVAMVLQLTLGPWIQDWPFLVRNAVFNAAVVAVLSWMVMPVVTRSMRRWLQPSAEPAHPPSHRNPPTAPPHESSS
ncbi:MAG: antibiotic biosynthesis monooxygenase [Verrucomicrobiales bacterium]|nr:antibiotic biosynthesis monooxygenase [Verrucomicrobiales bacterium]